MTGQEKPAEGGLGGQVKTSESLLRLLKEAHDSVARMTPEEKEAMPIRLTPTGARY